jgi:hypothetical protein
MLRPMPGVPAGSDHSLAVRFSPPVMQRQPLLSSASAFNLQHAAATPQSR